MALKARGSLNYDSSRSTQQYRMTAELDNGRLVEETTGVKKQDQHSRADEPATGARYLPLGAHDQSLLLRSVLHVHRSDPVVKQRDAGTAVERDE